MSDVRQDGSDIGFRNSCIEIEASLASEPCYSMREKLSRKTAVYATTNNRHHLGFLRDSRK